MEIERKFLVLQLPDDLKRFRCRLIEQGYLSTTPVVRVRRDNEDYYLTYKSVGFVTREEYNLPLTRESYMHLLGKADGNIITKKRYEIPIDYCSHIQSSIAARHPEHSQFLTIELDLFEGVFEGTVLAEVEFTSEEEALAFQPPQWFGEDVSHNPDYHNSNMSTRKFEL